eukprot:CAMPEP_0116059856 /NCGR_PEP_ID=MMETSP0322-20121206/6059_1 /TAXON_ID=163516 /ORGANISM="Leptocylindrus danicus var. apora, Strain B651" /LENGTH=87 /DNA_ID=CAMNT_0003544345 /DNA_START=41 /DNA_END=301 /DNA_ORIENTATION=-
MSEQIEDSTCTTVDIMEAAKEEVDAQDEKSDIKVGNEAVLEKDCSETAEVLSESQITIRLKRKQRSEKREAKRAKMLAEGRELERIW